MPTQQSYNQKISYPLIFFILLMSFPFTQWHTLKGLVSLQGGADRRIILAAAILLALTVFQALSKSPAFKQIFIKYSFAKSEPYHQVFKNKYSLILLCALGLIFCATLLNGVFQMGLSLIEPFFRPVFYFGFLICPFIIGWSKQDNIKTVHTAIIVFATVWAILHLIAFLVPQIYLQIVEEALRNEGERLGLNRFMSPMGIRLCWMYTYLYGVIKFTQNPSQNWKWSVLSALILFEIMFVSMLRRYFIFMILFGCLSFWLSTRNIYRKYFIVAVAVISIFGVFKTFPIFHTHILNLSSMAQDIGRTGGVLRLNALKYYWNEFEKTDYIGIGDYPNTRVRRSLSTYAQERFGFYLSDLGIFHGLLRYGFQAMILTVFAYYFMIKDSSRMIRKCETPFVNNIAKVLLLLVIWQIISIEVFIWDLNYCYYWGLLFYLYYAVGKFGVRKCPEAN